MTREAYVKNGNGSKEPIFRFDVDEKLSRYPGYYVLFFLLINRIGIAGTSIINASLLKCGILRLNFTLVALSYHFVN